MVVPDAFTGDAFFFFTKNHCGDGSTLSFQCASTLGSEAPPLHDAWCGGDQLAVCVAALLAARSCPPEADSR